MATSEFIIKVFYAGLNDDNTDRWQAYRDVPWSEERFYGTGETIEEALAEIGRKLQAFSDAEVAEFEEFKAKL